MKTSEWVKCSDRLPPIDTDVETKIDDRKGVRNVCALRRHSNLWWFTDMSMYIYYSPTHWRPLVEMSVKQALEIVCRAAASNANGNSECLQILKAIEVLKAYVAEQEDK